MVGKVVASCPMQAGSVEEYYSQVTPQVCSFLNNRLLHMTEYQACVLIKYPSTNFDTNEVSFRYIKLLFLPP